MKISEIEKKFVDVYHDNAPSEDTVSLWFHRFKSGDFSFEDQPRSGRPMELDFDALRTEVEKDPYVTTRDLATTLGVAQPTISHGLKSIGKVLKYGRFVPHDLTQFDLDRRVDASLSLLTSHRRFDWLDSIITGDEKWVLYDNVVRKRQWVDKDEQADDVPKANIHSKKIMVSVWWSVRGMEYWEVLDDGVTITADVYTGQLRRLKYHVENSRGKNAHIYFQHDNARPHVARKTKVELAGYGWTILPHPPYSPDLAPSDYYLFSDMQRHLGDTKFQSRSEVKTWLTSYFNSKSPEFWQRGIHKLPELWRKVIDKDGHYA